MLQAAAWISTRLRTLSWPRTPDPTHTARLIHVRESTLHHFASAALQATTPPPPHTPAVRIVAVGNRVGCGSSSSTTQGACARRHVRAT